MEDVADVDTEGDGPCDNLMLVEEETVLEFASEFEENMRYSFSWFYILWKY